MSKKRVESFWRAFTGTKHAGSQMLRMRRPLWRWMMMQSYYTAYDLRSKLRRRAN